MTAARAWHLEPSLTDPDTVYAGVEDAALSRSIDGGQTWQELSGLHNHAWRDVPYAVAMGAEPFLVGAVAGG